MPEQLKRDRINEGLSLLQNRAHLSFGTDALLLAGFVSRAERAAELGAGNGVISLLLASRGKCARIDAYEIQQSVAELCLQNVIENGFSKVITVKNEDVRLIGRELEGSYRAVFTNPPYMKINAGKDCAGTEKQIARHEVAGDIYDFCRSAARLLAFGADFYCVYRPDRLCDLFDAMRQSGIEPKNVVTVCESPCHTPSMVLVKGKRGGKAGLYFAPIFFIRDEAGYSADYLYVLEKGEFHERFRMP